MHTKVSLAQKIRHFAMSRCIPARFFVQRRYQKEFKRQIDLKKPLTFNEKIKWLMVYYREPFLHMLVDKYEVRRYVAERAGSEVLNDIYGIYDTPDQIDWDHMPEEFVLKATHGSGFNILCKDKSLLDIGEARAKLKQWLAIDYYHEAKEWGYKHLRRRIMAERYLHGDNGNPVHDYKVFCFHGEPKFTQVDTERFVDHRRDLYDLEWRLLPVTCTYAHCNSPVPRPERLAEMMDVARALSRELPFVRVDLYISVGRIRFGELTLYPGDGSEAFNPDEWDVRIGRWLDLSRVKRTPCWRREIF